MRAQIEFARGRGGDPDGRPLSDAAAELLGAAQQLAGLDDDLDRKTYLEALAAAMYAGRLGATGAVEEVAEAACAALDRVSELYRPIDFLLRGMADRITGGLAAGAPRHARSDSVWYRIGVYVVAVSAADIVTGY